MSDSRRRWRKRKPSLEPGFLSGDDENFDDAPPSFLAPEPEDHEPDADDDAWTAFTEGETPVKPPPVPGAPPSEPAARSEAPPGRTDPVTATDPGFAPPPPAAPSPPTEVPPPPARVPRSALIPDEEVAAAGADEPAGEGARLFAGGPLPAALQIEPDDAFPALASPAEPDRPSVEPAPTASPATASEPASPPTAVARVPRPPGDDRTEITPASRIPGPPPTPSPDAATEAVSAGDIPPPPTAAPAPPAPPVELPPLPPPHRRPAPSEPREVSAPRETGESGVVSAARWRSDAGEYDDHGWEEITAEFRAMRQREEEEARVPEPGEPAVSEIDFDEDEEAYETEAEGAAPARRSSRNVPIAVVTGLAFGLVALLFIWIGRPLWMVLVLAVLMLALVEFYTGLRRARMQPAAAPGLLGALVMLVGTYRQGTEALGFGLTLVLVFCLLWFLLGVIRTHPAANLGVTLLGVVYVTFLGSFAVQILGFVDWSGITLAMLALAIANDVGAFVVGSRLGRTALLPAVSPTKSIQGLLGGAVATLAVSLLVFSHVHPFDLKSSIGIAVVVMVAAPLGDLFESMLKRAVGVKDLGSILPGHGGVIDRIDSLLVVAPAVYYFVRLLDISPLR